jgi:TPR repeat protein
MHWLWWLLGGLAAAVVLFLVFRGARGDTADRYLTAAYKGNVEAQYKLAECYYNGRGVDIDYASAGTWYRKSAEAGYAQAQYSLGNLLYIGLGVDEDEAEAVKWYQKAADSGNAKAKSILLSNF